MTLTRAPSYEVVVGWEQLPTGYDHPAVADVAVDSTGRAYPFCRSARGASDAPARGVSLEDLDDDEEENDEELEDLADAEPTEAELKEPAE
ncbi:MAG TPA: hypothetical protein VGR85_01580 [Candidatus Limnocylindria bacterium]|nr:hypothetical protein [Candidatus Limnocylindria bacterium]